MQERDGQPTSYQPVDANVGESRNGTVLMVEAYVLVWLLLLGWLLFMWLRQRTIDARVDGLEAAVARAEARRRAGRGEGASG